jgi:hypothetical protein
LDSFEAVAAISEALDVGIVHLAISVSLARVLSLSPICFSRLQRPDAILTAMFAQLSLEMEQTAVSSAPILLAFLWETV